MIQVRNSELHKERKSTEEGVSEGKIKTLFLLDLADSVSSITATMYSVIYA